MATKRVTTAIGSRFRSLREATGFGVRAMGKAVGLSAPTHYGAIENGSRVDPRISTLVMICEATGVELVWLATGRGPTLAAHPDLDSSQLGPLLRERLTTWQGPHKKAAKTKPSARKVKAGATRPGTKRAGAPVSRRAVDEI